MTRKIILGLGCLALSFCALADEATGGLEGMIDQMEKHGATHDLQMGKPFDPSASPAAEPSEDEGPTENPVTRVITPARPPRPQPLIPTPASGPGDQQNPATVSVQPAVPPAPPAPPEPARHNPLADQPVASGGLEQIFNIMELNASRPMRAGTPPAESRPGVQSEAKLSEKLGR